MIRSLLQSVVHKAQSSDTSPRLASNASRGCSRRKILGLAHLTREVSQRWKVVIDAGRCTDCSACVRVCPTSALARCQADAIVSYRLDVQRCDGCRDCVQVCAEQALVLLESDEPTEVREAVHLRIARCVQCGQSGAGLIDGQCSICRQSRLKLPTKGYRLR